MLRVKEHADNVLKARGWKVKRLIEICCCERKNMGTNLGVGGWCRGDGPGAAHTIALRLRRPRSHEFVSFEHCLKVMWHEMAHIVHGNHSAAFYQEMDDIARHYELIKSKGQLVGLDGFPIGGGRNADPQRHNPSRAEGRAAGSRPPRPGRRSSASWAAGASAAAPRTGSCRRARPRPARRSGAPRTRGTASATPELEVAAGRGEKRKSGPGLVWDGTFRAVCPVCGPVCTDKVEHAEVISDSDDDDLAGPVDYTQESQADEKAPAPAKPAARPRPAPTAQARLFSTAPPRGPAAGQAQGAAVAHRPHRGRLGRRGRASGGLDVRALHPCQLRRRRLQRVRGAAERGSARGGRRRARASAPGGPGATRKAAPFDPCKPVRSCGVVGAAGEDLVAAPRLSRALRQPWHQVVVRESADRRSGASTIVRTPPRAPRRASPLSRDHEFRRVGEDDPTGGGAVSTARRLS